MNPVRALAPNTLGKHNYWPATLGVPYADMTINNVEPGRGHVPIGVAVVAPSVIEAMEFNPRRLVLEKSRSVGG